MRINDALMQEVFRRAEVIREKQLQRRKLLMGLSCVVLSLAAMVSQARPALYAKVDWRWRGVHFQDTAHACQRRKIIT